jgi:hypothetical protein
MFDSRRLSAAIAIAAFSGISAAQGPLSGVSIPPGSQDAPCWPVWHAVYSVSAPPYALDVNSGIGRLLKTDDFGVYPQFALHDHVYVAPQVPDPNRAVVDFVFRWPTAVYGVEIIQHTNGVTQIEGFGGPSSTNLTSAGLAFGPIGDVSGFNLIPEFVSQVFTLPTPACGEHFRLIVRKTSHVDGWASYRMFLLDAVGVRIPVASAPEALAASVTSASSSAGLQVDLILSAGAAFAGDPYVFIGSTSGACPGIAVPGVGSLPVVYDLFAAYTFLGPWAPETQGYQGTLDAAGVGTAHVLVAPGAYPSLVGLTFTHAAAAVDANAVLFSNPVSFIVAP